MSETNSNKINLANSLGWEDLDDNAAAAQSGGFAARFFDNDTGGISPVTPELGFGDFVGSEKTFNLEEISRRTGLNIDNVTDGFAITNTVPGARYQVLVSDDPNGDENPGRFEFSGDRTVTLNGLRNKVSRVEVRQIA